MLRPSNLESIVFMFLFSNLTIKMFKETFDTFLITVAEPLQRQVHRYLDFFINVNFFEAFGDGISGQSVLALGRLL